MELLASLTEGGEARTTAEEGVGRLRIEVTPVERLDGSKVGLATRSV